MCAFTLIILLSAGITADAQKFRRGKSKIVVATIGKHPRHKNFNFDKDLLAELSHQLKLLEVKQKLKLNRENVARVGNLVAFTATVPLGDTDTVRFGVFIQDTAAKKLYEIEGFDFPRPITDLNWENKTTLVFDQWMQPHHAAHYVFNVKNKKLVGVGVFGDE